MQRVHYSNQHCPSLPSNLPFSSSLFQNRPTFVFCARHLDSFHLFPNWFSFLSGLFPSPSSPSCSRLLIFFYPSHPAFFSSLFSLLASFIFHQHHLNFLLSHRAIQYFPPFFLCFNFPFFPFPLRSTTRLFHYSLHSPPLFIIFVTFPCAIHLFPSVLFVCHPPFSSFPTIKHLFIFLLHIIILCAPSVSNSMQKLCNIP